MLPLTLYGIVICRNSSLPLSGSHVILEKYSKTLLKVKQYELRLEGRMGPI